MKLPFRLPNCVLYDAQPNGHIVEKPTLKLISVVVAGLAASGAHAAEVAISAINAPIVQALADGDAVSYASFPGSSTSVLVVRPGAPVLCARKPGAAPGSSQVVVDPNGFLPPYSVANMQFQNDRGVVVFPAGSQFRTGEAIPYSSASYAADPDLLLVVDNVLAPCVEGLDETSPGPEQIACPTVADGDVDSIRRGDFELATGELAVSSRIVDFTGSAVYYEHTLRAENGAVNGIQFREQFPYHGSTGVQPRFAKSLGIESEWNCRPSEDAHCGGQNRSQAGLGYATLDNAHLEANACIKIIAIRSIRDDGLNADDFSGSIHAAGFSVTGQPIRQTRIQFDN